MHFVTFGKNTITQNKTQTVWNGDYLEQISLTPMQDIWRVHVCPSKPSYLVLKVKEIFKMVENRLLWNALRKKYYR